MALAIGVAKSHIIYLNDEPLQVMSCGSNTLTVSFKGKEHAINTVSKTDIGYGVKLFCSSNQVGLRLCFEAPKDVHILREKLYKERANGYQVRK